MNEYYDHPLPKKGDLIRITEVHSQGGNATFKIGELVEVSSAWQDKDTGVVHFRANVTGRKKNMLYSSKTYDWEIFGKEFETMQQAQEDTAKFVQEKSEKRFEEIWENWKKDKVFPEQLFENKTMRWMFSVVFYSAFEDGWNACVMNNMNEHMREVELCLNELGKLTGVNVKEPKK